MEDRRFKRDGLSIYYRTGGASTRRPALLLHGWPWFEGVDAVAEALSRDFYVIAPELPGMGRSEPLPTPVDLFHSYAQVLADLVQAEANAPPILIGQSFGGAIASALAAHMPDQVGALVLVDALMPAVPRLDRLSLFLMVRANLFGVRLIPHLPKALRRRVLRSVFGVPIGFDPLDSESGRIELLRSYALTIDRAMRGRNELVSLDWSQLLFPVLFVWGSRDNRATRHSTRITHIDDAKALCEHIRGTGKTNVAFVELDGGHTVLYDRPDSVVDIITEQLHSLGVDGA